MGDFALQNRADVKGRELWGALGPHPTKFRHPPFAHSSGRFCFAKPGGCQGREAWRGALGPNPAKFRHLPFAHFEWAILLCKTGQMSREGSLGGHWVPIPRSFDICPSPTQVGDFALQNRTDVKGGKPWGALGPHPTEFRHLPFAHSSGRFCFAKPGGCQGRGALGGYWTPIPRGFSVRSSPVWGERMSRNMDSEKTGRLSHTIYNGVSTSPSQNRVD